MSGVLTLVTIHGMRAVWDPFSFVVVSIPGWMKQHQQQIIEYLVEEIESFANKSATADSDSAMISAADLPRRQRR